MSELRRDPVSDRWVIIANERSNRPDAFVQEEAETAPSFDPFAEGNEDRTPPEITARRAPGTLPGQPGWRVRVVPNKYPALMVEGDLDKRAMGVHDRMSGVGAHEVIIEMPQTMRSFTGLPDSHVREVLEVYRDRLLDLQGDIRLRYAIVFKNVGKLAGATVYHSHSQLVALPIIPRSARWRLANFKRYHEFHERCLLCDLAVQELEQEARLVLDSGTFVAYVPYAGRFPFEVWIQPKFHVTHYERMGGDALEELAFLLKRTLLKMEKGLGQPAYNYMVHTAPFRTAPAEHAHWHMEITPRLTRAAGFEWGTGFYINPLAPEDAAQFLRNVKV